MEEREKAEDGEERYGVGGNGGTGGSREGHVIRWDSFLPRRSLRVLLVESDDSTRHIVTALLRKCNYRVAGVADAMKAWELMMEKRYKIDLVLTEVAMPYLSGIELLSKIVSAEECKNIPVIMMSTHDSVNVVLKCMLKGAVDFLVKPLRKNELRNLWQHVWRRHCSNSFMNASDNNTASNQISANASGRFKTEESNDERSDAQSSGNKQDIEFESIPNHEEHLQVEDRRTSEVGANLDPSDKGMTITIRESVSKMEGCTNKNDYKLVGISVNVTLPMQKASLADASEEPNQLCDISSCRVGNFNLVRPTEENKDDPNTRCKNNAPNESRQDVTIIVEPRSNVQCSSAALKGNDLVEDGLRETAKPYVGDASNIGASPSWELSLRRPQTNGSAQLEIKEKHVLKQSVTSAFSRYGDKKILSSANKPVLDLCVRTKDNDNEKNTLFSPTEKRLSSPRGNRGETTVHFQVSSTNKENTCMHSPAMDNECAVHSNMENSTLHCPQIGFLPVPIHVGSIPYQNLCAQYGGVVQPIFYRDNSGALEKPTIQLPFTNHSFHHNNHSFSLEFHHHEVIDHSCQWRQPIDVSKLGETRELCNPCGSCSQDVLRGSGSNGSGETADGIRNNMGTTLESGNESGVQNCNWRLDGDRSRRQAALMKFRLKRKDRCFEKKVRYHSRKKLAEQRPRIKGQFVRQKTTDPTTTTGADN